MVENAVKCMSYKCDWLKHGYAKQQRHAVKKSSKCRKLENVGEFKSLGSLVDRSNDTTKKIQKRIINVNNWYYGVTN